MTEAEKVIIEKPKKILSWPAETKEGRELRLKIQNHFSSDDIDEVIELAKKRMKDPKNIKLLAFIIEQLFGKAPQRLEVSGKDGQPIMVMCDPDAMNRYNAIEITPEMPDIARLTEAVIDAVVENNQQEELKNANDPSSIPESSLSGQTPF